jgi:spermidine synthase
LRHPVRVYALLELGIALSALAVPLALSWAGRLRLALLGGVEVSSEAGALNSALFYLMVAFAILLVPTALMGATLPLLARQAVRSDQQVGPRVGLLYTANTVGAAAGTLLAAFVLLPRLGLGFTVLVAVAVNVAVFLLAVLLGRKAEGVDAPSSEASRSSAEKGQNASWILPLILVSGFVSFSWEVLWTRLLSHLLGGTVYAFGTMLATFLAGIALGAAVASRLATNASRAGRGFAVAQLGVAAFSMAAFAAVDHLPRWVEGLHVGGASLARSASLASLTLLPGAIFVGATFPFAVRILAGNASQAGAASARVYAWNTIGAIGGAVMTGFFVLPTLAIAGTATLAVTLSLGLALATALLVKPRPIGLVVAAMAGFVVLVFALPQTPWQVLRTAPLSGRPAVGEVAFYGVGRSATVLLIDENGNWRLSTNGLPEAAIQPPGARVGGFTVARWMALLPLVSRPDARSMLIIGLGAGLTLDSVPAAIEEIHVVELEPEVVEANRRVAGERGRDPLADPRLSLHVHDARSALTLSSRHFDAIVSQPSHPWTSGSSHLFTREFFSLVHQRLDPQGVFIQWIGLRYVDADLLRSLVATLVDVFAHVEVYQPFPGGGVLFLCGDEPLTNVESAARALAGSGEEWRRMGLFTPQDIFSERLLTSEESRRFALGAPLNTDYRNLLKIRSPKILGDPIGASGVRQLLADFDPLRELPVEAEGIYAVRRLIRRNTIGRARRVAAGLRDPQQREVATALTHLVSGRPRLGEKALWSALESETTSSEEAFHALLLLRRRDLVEGRIPERLAERLGKDSQAAAVVEGWSRARLGDPLAIGRVEGRLASLDSQHPLFDAATALRVIWRQATGEVEAAREALVLLEPWLAYGANAAGLLRRARLAVQAEAAPVALASVAELAEFLVQNPQARRQVEEGLVILEGFPPAWKDERHTRLVARMVSLLDK